MKKPETYNSPVLDELLKDITPEELEKTEKRMQLAARIDDAIKAKGWKKKDFAKALGKTPSEITKWLSGTHNFTTDTLFDIERVLGICILKFDDRQSKTINTFVCNLTIQSPKPSKASWDSMLYNKASKQQFSAQGQFNTSYSDNYVDTLKN